MTLDIKNIKKQTDFCLNLMERLRADIWNDECDPSIDCYGIRYHKRKQNDIIRLRRELNRLNKLLDPWG